MKQKGNAKLKGMLTALLASLTALFLEETLLAGEDSIRKMETADVTILSDI